MANLQISKKLLEDVLTRFTVDDFGYPASAGWTMRASFQGSHPGATLQSNRQSYFDLQTAPNNVGTLVLYIEFFQDGFPVKKGYYDIIVDPVDDAPVVAKDIPDATMSEESTWSYKVESGTFTDIDSLTLTYSATLADGTPLPAWVTFDSATQTFSANAPKDWTGTLEIKLTATGTTASTSKVFKLVVSHVNDAPTVTGDIAGAGVNEGELWSLQLPEGLFTDVDGDTLTYSATLADDAALPSWLIFNPVSRTFSGTPPAGSAGTLYIKVIASDGSLEASKVFTLNILELLTNKAPTVQNPLSDVQGVEDTAWTFQVPADTFTDVDGDALSYSASLPDGRALPLWITFDPSSRTFNANPPKDYDGSITIKVTATDGALSASQTFTLNFKPVNDAPTRVIPLLNQTFAEDEAIEFDNISGAFNDVDGDTLTYSATLEDGQPLPAWLSFDSQTGRVSGQAPKDFHGSLQITVTATDGKLSATGTYALVIAPRDDAPEKASDIPDVEVSEGSVWSYQIPADLFVDADGDPLTYSASLNDGSALPSWLSFDPVTRTFSGKAPDDFYGKLSLKVMASANNKSVSDTFSLNVKPENDAPVLKSPLADQHVDINSSFSFQLAADAFTDPDSDLTLTVALADGSGLPAWITYDAASRTFSGQPPQDYQGSLQIKVTASDGSLSASDTFTIWVAPPKADPILSRPIADQTVAEDTPWTFQFDAGTFTDADSPVLAYTATLEGGNPLPSWLHFDGTTRTLSGKPPADWNGIVTITVTASDGSASVSDTYSLIVTPKNDAPRTLTLAQSSVREQAAVGTRVGELSAFDPDAGSSLSYELLDDAGGRFALDGTKLVVGNGDLLDFEKATSHQVKVRVSDGAGGILDQIFTITLDDMMETIRGTNAKNKLTGGIGADKIMGGLGNDTLTGGAGSDAFVFNTKLNAKSNKDKIVDFNVTDDAIWLENAIFKKVGKLGSEADPVKLDKKFFVAGTKAKDKNDYIIYDKKKGVLYYDQDGSGKKKAVEIATLSKNLKMTADDFFVI